MTKLWKIKAGKRCLSTNLVAPLVMCPNGKVHFKKQCGMFVKLNFRIYFRPFGIHKSVKQWITPLSMKGTEITKAFYVCQLLRHPSQS